MYVTAGLQFASFLPIAKVAKYNDIQKKEESKLQNKNVLLEGGGVPVDSEEKDEMLKMNEKLDSKQDSIIKIDCEAISSSDE